MLQVKILSSTLADIKHFKQGNQVGQAYYILNLRTRVSMSLANWTVAEGSRSKQWVYPKRYAKKKISPGLAQNTFILGPYSSPCLPAWPCRAEKMMNSYPPF